MEEQADELYELMGKKKPVEVKNSNIAESNLFRNVSDAEYSMLDDADKATANMKYWNDKANFDAAMYDIEHFPRKPSYNSQEDADTAALLGDDAVPDSDKTYLTHNIAKLEKRLTPEQQKQYQTLNSYLSYINDDKEDLIDLAKQMTGKNYGDIYPEAILSMFLNNPDKYSFEDDLDLAQANDSMANVVERELTDADNSNEHDMAFDAMDAMLDKRTSDKSKNKFARQIEVNAAKKSGDPGNALTQQEYAAFDVADNNKMDWGTKGTVLAALRDASRY